MKLIDISPEYLNKKLASKICKNKSLRKKYIEKYDLVGGATESLNKKALFIAILAQNHITFIHTMLKDDHLNRIIIEDIPKLVKFYLNVHYKLYTQGIEEAFTLFFETKTELQNYALNLHYFVLNKSILESNLRLYWTSVYNSLEIPQINLETVQNNNFEIINISKQSIYYIENVDIHIYIYKPYKQIIELQLKNTLPQTNIFTFNVGIEIETCIKKDFAENISFYYFSKESDSAIQCNESKDLVPVEFVLKTPINSVNIRRLNYEINTIVENNEGCENFSCNLHYHISNEQILFNTEGIIFVLILLYKWIETYQDIFVNEYPYTLNIPDNRKGVGYKATKNDAQLNEIDALINKYIQTPITPNSNITEIYAKIINLDKTDTIGRPILAIVPDNKYIHVEFRGLLTSNDSDKHTGVNGHIIKMNTRYINSIKVMFNDVLNTINNKEHYLQNIGSDIKWIDDFKLKYPYYVDSDTVNKAYDFYNKYYDKFNIIYTLSITKIDLITQYIDKEYIKEFVQNYQERTDEHFNESLIFFYNKIESLHINFDMQYLEIKDMQNIETFKTNLDVLNKIFNGLKEKTITDIFTDIFDKNKYKFFRIGEQHRYDNYNTLLAESYPDYKYSYKYFFQNQMENIKIFIQMIDKYYTDKYGPDTPMFRCIFDNNEIYDIKDIMIQKVLPDLFDLSIISKLKNINSLTISNHTFNTNIPDEIYNLTKLTWLDLSNNHLIGNIKENISKLLLLKYLDLSNNNLKGIIPTQLWELQNLNHIHLNNNPELEIDIESYKSHIKNYPQKYSYILIDNIKNIEVTDFFYNIYEH